MINVATFDSLTPEQKVLLVGNAGLPVVSITQGNLCISLFLLDEVFVEHYYNAGTARVEKIVLASEVSIDKYLEHISIAHLL